MSNLINSNISNNISLTVPNNIIINIDIENDIKKKLITQGNFNKLDLSDSNLQFIMNKYPSVNLNIIRSIYDSYIKEKIIINHNTVEKNLNNIVQNFYNGFSIKKLSFKFDYPAINLIRLILSKKYSKKNIKIILKNIEYNTNNINSDPNNINSNTDDIDSNTNSINSNTGDIKSFLNLTQYEYTQILLAFNIDFFTKPNQQDILANSLEFEYKIYHILTKFNIKFKTQEDIIHEQQKTKKPLNTPDFLILTNLFINNIKINWIEVKNFFGTNSYFQKKKINEQISRYFNTWGSGCLIFSLGYSLLLEKYYNKNKNILLLNFENFKLAEKIK